MTVLDLLYQVVHLISVVTLFQVHALFALIKILYSHSVKFTEFSIHCDVCLGQAVGVVLNVVLPHVTA